MNKEEGSMKNDERKKLKSQGGFTLIELLIYTTMTAIIVGLFGAILITVTKIQGQQNSSVQITREMNFLLNAMTSRLRDASTISTPAGSSPIIVFRTNTYPASDTTLELLGQKVYLTENGQSAVALSSDRILIDDLAFDIAKDTDSPSSTAVIISITASFNSTNPQLEETRSVQTSVSPLLQSQ